VNGATNTSQPGGLSGVVVSRSASFTATTTAPGGVAPTTALTANATGTTSKPDADLPGTQGTAKWYTGQFLVDIDADGTKETAHFVLTDETNNGSIDYIDLSSDDADFGEITGGPLSGQTPRQTGPDDDERIAGGDADKDVRLGPFYTFTVAFISDGSSASITSKTWFKARTGTTDGVLNTDLDGDGIADDTFYAVLTDDDSDGIYEKLDLSIGDQIFGETAGGTLTDGEVDFNASNNTNDERRTASSDASSSSHNVKMGVNTFTFTWDTTPGGGTNALTFFATWYTGAMTLDANADGDLSDSVDTLNFVISDTDSDGVYERLDLSLSDATYQQGGELTDTEVSTSGDDEKVLSSESLPKQLTLGAYKFRVNFSSKPGDPSVTADVTITPDTWFTGAFTIDADANGSANDTVNFVLIDALNGDALYDAMDLSTNDADYGDGNRTNQITGSDNDESIATGEDVRLGDHYTSTVAFDNNPGLSGADNDASITSKTWFTGNFDVDINADGDTSDTGDDVHFVVADTDSDGRFDTLDLSIADTDFGEGGALSGQGPPRLTSDGDDERLDRATSTGGSNSGNSGTVDVRLGANYLFTIAFDNNPATTADSSDVTITAKTHFEGRFQFDADRNDVLETDGTNSVYFALSDLDSNGLYDTMDLSLSNDTRTLASLQSDFGQGSLTDLVLTATAIGAAANNDERYGTGGNAGTFQKGNRSFNGAGTNTYTADATTKIGIEYSVEATWATNPPSSALNGVANQDALILHVQTTGSTLVYTALDSWQIDADGDEAAEDHVFFVLSLTGSTGVVDTIDISIGDQVFGETAGGSLTDGAVSFGASDNDNDERFACTTFPCSKVVTLGTHPFLVEFDSTVNGDTDDARISARWYTGAFPADVDNDRADNTLDFVLVDDNSDGLYTVMELDGDDSGAYDASEVHRSAGERWSRPRIAADAGSDDVGRHTSIDVTGDDTAFVVYYDVTNRNLLFTKTTNEGLDWSTPVTIDSAGDVGQFPSLQAVTASTLYVSYSDASNGILKFAKSADGGATWTTSEVDAGPNVGSYSALAAVDAATIYISYYDAGSANLKVAKSSNSGGTWASAARDSTGDVGKYTSIAVLPDNNLLDASSTDDITVYVSYYDATNGNLKFTRSTDNGATWVGPTTVDGSANDVGQYTSVAAHHDPTPNDDAAAGDTAYISYYDATDKNLKFAKTVTGGDAAGEWSTSTIDSSTNDVGQFSSIASSEVQSIWIVYYDATDRTLKSIRSTNGSTTFGTPVTIDDGRSVGQYASVAHYRTHTLYASYYDAPEQRLRVAKSRLLVDLEGHRMSVRWSMDPTDASSAVLVDGRITELAQLSENTWLFKIPRDAEPGPNIEQSQIRVVLKARDDGPPAYYHAHLKVMQVE
jgi:hypothetical protein